LESCWLILTTGLEGVDYFKVTLPAGGTKVDGQSVPVRDEWRCQSGLLGNLALCKPIATRSNVIERYNVDGGQASWDDYGWVAEGVD